MLTELYIEALLDEEELAYLVRELWEQRKIGDQVAMTAWPTLQDSDNHLV